MLEDQLLKAGEVDNRALDHALICRILPRSALNFDAKKGDLQLPEDKVTAILCSTYFLVGFTLHLFFR